MTEAIRHIPSSADLHEWDVIFGDADGLPWLRKELDRHVAIVDTGFTDALGEDSSLVGLTCDLAEQPGLSSLRLLDAGGGTGHTMRTLVDTVVQHTVLGPDQVTGAVLNNNNFADQSLSAATRRAFADGKMPYAIGDIADLPIAGVSQDSFDIVYAYESLIHMRRPDLGLRRLMRVARPAGHILASVMCEDAGAINNMLHGRHGLGWRFRSATMQHALSDGRSAGRSFYHLTRSSRRNHR
jgi:SAM-dependent methyltransferase